VDVGPLVDRVLSATERGALDQLEPEARRRSFYRSWTRKEAYLKALGVGLVVALDELDMTGDHVESPFQGELRGILEPGTGWSLHDADLGSGYVATLAVEGDLRSPPEIRGSIDEPADLGPCLGIKDAATRLFAARVRTCQRAGEGAERDEDTERVEEGQRRWNLTMT
jgi:hypothetical protein